MTEFNYTISQEFLRKYIVLDIETTERDGVDHLLEEPEAPKNLKDPAKIQEAIEEKKRKQREEKALDICLNRIVAISFRHCEHEAKTLICTNEKEEMEALDCVWSLIRPVRGAVVPIVGFRCKTFDIPVMLQRMRLLGMPMPNYDYGKFSKGTCDIAEILSFGDPKWEPGAQLMRRRLTDYCRLFGIPVEDDDKKGGDVPDLIRQGKYDEVAYHCQKDIERTELLARRIGAIV